MSKDKSYFEMPFFGLEKTNFQCMVGQHILQKKKKGLEETENDITRPCLHFSFEVMFKLSIPKPVIQIDYY